MSATKTFVAAMSGGVDSSVAASIFINQKHRVIGATLKMKNCDDTREKTKACCGLDDNIQVRLAAEKLGIPHYFVDVRSEFKEKILKYAMKEYAYGRTPNPCVYCNFYLKFGVLLNYAKEIGAEGIITGHYAIINRDISRKARIFKGIDDIKNQSYFLCYLTHEQLNFSYMPLGELTKKEVRQIAERLDLPNAKKTESQDACFGYKGETFAQTLSRIFGYIPKSGNIINEKGKILGKHNGIHNFTLGQRKGLRIALGTPAFVAKINQDTNEITVSTDEQLLLTKTFTATNMNWLDFPYEQFECEVQVRYRQTPQKAIVYKKENSTALVELAEPLRAVTPGQALAVYNGNQLIAGGWIDKLL